MQVEDPEDEEDEPLQVPFTATGTGKASWEIVGGSACSGGGEFPLSYEVAGVLDPKSRHVEINIVEKWLGGSSTMTCAGVTATEPHPTFDLQYGPMRMSECDSGSPHVEQESNQGGAALGITWSDTFSVRDLFIPTTTDQDASASADDAIAVPTTDPDDASAPADDATVAPTTDPDEASTAADDATVVPTSDSEDAAATVAPTAPPTLDPDEASATVGPTGFPTVDPNEASAPALSNCR